MKAMKEKRQKIHLRKQLFHFAVLGQSRMFKKGIFDYSYFKKGCRKNVHSTIPKGNMGYDQYTVPDTEAVEPTFVAFL